ncbi:MAG: ISNCY family transposase [Chlamydiota bacterium]
MGGRITMSNKELDRLFVLQEAGKKRHSNTKLAERLGVSVRQAIRLKNKFNKEGPKGLMSKKVGIPSNNQVPQAQKELVLAFLSQEDHRDFGPTLTHEYLAENQALSVSISSVRSIMIQNGLWRPNEVSKKKIHRLRPRRERKGELIQLDGSEHDWFEGRGPRCSLLVYVDDATSETMHLKFVKSENLWDYFRATEEYILQHGRPEAFYPDKHSVFRVNREGALSGDGLTQFGRAMKELDIELICANSPQAKGRVERKNRDFQNRLVKAMRLAKICDIEAANAFLPSFLERFNQKFAKVPKDPGNAHKPLLSTQQLDRIFCIKDSRHLSKNLTLQYKNVLYQIVVEEKKEYTLRNAHVTILESHSGEIRIEYKGKRLHATAFHKMEARTEVVSAKELIATLKERKRGKPTKKHPWKRGPRGYSKKHSELVCV